MKYSIFIVLMFSRIAFSNEASPPCKITDADKTVAGYVKSSGTIVTMIPSEQGQTKERVVGSIDKGEQISSSAFSGHVGRIGLDGEIS